MLQSAQIEHSLAQVLDLAEEIGYGEIYNVELGGPNAPCVAREITAEQHKFIQMVAGMGITSITKLVVHNGCPSVMEIPGERHGYAYRQKLKIV